MGGNIKLWDIGSASHDRLLAIIQEFVNDGYEQCLKKHIGKKNMVKMESSVVALVAELDEEISKEIEKRKKIFKSSLLEEINERIKDRIKETVSDCIMRLNDD